METFFRFFPQWSLSATGGNSPPIVIATDSLFPGSLVAIKSITLPNELQKGTLDLLTSAEKYLSLNHPNLATPVDVFIEPSKPTQLNLVTEFIAGESPLTGSRLLSTEAFLNLLGQICSVLHYLHARGFAHLDIHPGNLLLQPPTDEIPRWGLKLIDVPFFDLRTILAHRDILSFCPTYAAPEILNGGRFDHRADLYSLGVLLFQLLLEDFPLGPNTKHSASRHRELLEDNRIELITPEFLSPIVKKLLSPEQERRYTSAHFVYEDICAHLKDKCLEFDPHPLNARSYCFSPLVTSPEFEGELQKLSGWLATRSDSQSHSIIISGPRAIGKTRFSRTIGFYLSVLGNQIGTLKYEGNGKQVVILEGIPNTEARESAPQKVPAHSLVIFCDVVRDHTFRIEPRCSLLSTKGPILIILNDTGLSLLNGPVHTFQDEDGNFQITLSALPIDQARHFIDRVLVPNDLTDAAKDSITQTSLALTGLVVEQIAFLVSTGVIRRNGARWKGSYEEVRDADTAPKVLAELSHSWESLTKPRALLIALLTLAPLPVPHVHAAAAIDLDVSELPQLIQPFLSVNGLVSDDKGLLLTSTTLRRLALLRIEPSQRVALAREALYYFERKLPNEPSALHGLCTHYALEIGKKGIAAKYALLAAQYYEQNNNPAPALDFYRIALEYDQNEPKLSNPHLLAKALKLLAQMGDRQQFLAGAQVLEQLIEPATSFPRAPFLLQLANSYVNFDFFDRSLEIARALVDLPESQITPGERAMALDVVSFNYLRLGRTLDAMASARLSIRIWARLGDKHQMVHALRNLAGAFYLEGDYQKALACQKQSLHFDQIANRGPKFCNSVVNLGILQMESGDLRGAHRSLSRGLALASQTRRLLNHLEAGVNLAMCVQLAGDLNSSARLHREVTSLSFKKGYRHVLHASELTYAETLLFRGHFDEALLTIKHAEEGFISLRNTSSIFTAALQHASVLHHLGMYRESQLRLFGLLKNLEGNRYRALHVLCRLGVASNHIALGDLVASHKYIEEAGNGLPDGHVISNLSYRGTLAKLLWFRAELPSATRVCILMAEIARRKGYKLFLFEAWLNLSRIHIANGSFEEAGSTLRRLCGLHQRLKYSLFEPWLFQAMGDHAAAVGEERESKKHLLNARTSLLEMAYNISDLEMRRHFLNRPDSRALLARSEDLEDLAYEGFPEPQGSPQATRALESIARINEQLHRRDSLKSTLGLILDEAIRLSEAERGIVFLFDPSGREELKVSRNVGRRSLADARRYTRTALQRIRHGEIVFAADTFTDPQLSAAESITQLRIRSVTCVPLRSRNSVIGALYLDSRRPRLAASPELLKSLEIFAQQAAAALERAIRYFHLAEENRKLRETALVGVPTFIGQGTYFTGLKKLIAAASNSDLPVLILGESGTGKELVARAIHYSGKRSVEPFLSVDCGALPENLVESELFGYRRGAFTGADQDKEGLFVAAGGGSLFLDEIGNTAPTLQAKLLRAIQEREIRPLGATQAVSFRARLIAATNRDLRRDARDGRFRQDLLFRLNGITIEIPSLRDRKAEVPLLMNHFLLKNRERYNHRVTRISDEALQALSRYDWPGNIRELENCIERAVALAQEETIHLKDLPDSVRSACIVSWSEKKGEHRLIEEALARFAGDKSRAAEYIGWNRQKLYRKMEQYNIPIDFGRRNTA